MAGEEQARLDFTDILNNLNRKFEIILVKWINDRDFEVRIRTEIDRGNDDFNGLCDEWVDLFSGVTSTVWVKKISNTGPKIRFRKQYQCWTQGTGKVQKELLFDSRRCKGVLDMKVLTDTPLTRRKNKHIRMGLNAVVKINFSHLHPVDTSARFSCFVHNCPPQTTETTTILPSMQEVKLPPATLQLYMPSTDVSDPLLMCPPTIMFDASSTSLASLQPHVHTHVHHSQPTTPHGHYL